jgi:hypothetical protein
MNQGVWLAMVQVVAVQQPEVEKHQRVESQVECVVVREAV